jgi:hypothetical protein
VRRRVTDATGGGFRDGVDGVTGRVIRAGLLYFALTFGAGFVLGPIRILWLVPRIGARAAELVELPVMLAITWLAAGWVTRRLHVPDGWRARLGMGALATVLMIAAEFSLVLRLRGLTLDEYFATRDPVSGTAYYLALLLLALMPLIVGRRPSPAGRG